MRKKQINNPQITIFISWSGNYSKIIAEELKRVIEQDVFAKENVRCFVSTMDIASGEDWYNKIKNELRKSKLGIICITKENVKAPWLYFEAGALVGHNMRVVPLLVNCDQRSLEHTPIQSNQSIQFYTTERFLKMLDDIRAMFGFLGELKEEERENRYNRAYDKMKQNLKPILEEMKGKRYFSERYIYPPEIHTMTMDTVYISAPMSTLSDGEYKEQQAFLRQLSQELLNSKRFKKVYCPAIEVNATEWEGITTAVSDNYLQLRQVEHLIVVYPKTVATSSLVEIGYGIALCKNIVIFYKDKLPYMLDGAAEDIPHLHTRQYSKFEDISKAIHTDRSLFEVKRDE